MASKEVNELGASTPAFAHQSSPDCLVEHLHVVVFRTDCSGRWLYLNPAWGRLTGYGIESSIGHVYTDYVHPEDRQRSLEEFLPLMRRERETSRIRLRVITKAGEFKWVAVYLKALFSADNSQLEGAVGTLDDITELMATERVMQEARERAELADRTKSEFLATMSHELRTPMNAIIGLTDLVLTSPMESEQQKHLKMVRSSAGSLLEIIEEILLFSNLEAGRVRIERNRFDLREVLGQALAPLLFQAMENRLELNWRVQPEMPPHVIGDALRLKQVLHQLVGHAVRCTRDGLVVVDVSMTPDSALGDGKARIQFSVTDSSGFGAEEYRRALRAAFPGAEGNQCRRQSGSGVGLVLSVRILELMEGRVWLDEQCRTGTRFVFDVVFDLPQPERPQAAAANGLSRKILVAEDNTVNQHLIKHILLKMGHQPKIVANGRLCVEAWEGGGFDAILMDVQMPEMSGLEATVAIRQREKETGGHIPIIAVTANAVLGDRDICLKSGMDDYITKPIKNQLLEEAITRLTSVVQAVKVASTPPMPLEPLMQFDQALEGADGDQDLLRSLMELFLLRTPDCLAKIEKALDGDDASTAMLQAHSLKGSLRMLCAAQAEDFAFRLERAGRLRDVAEAKQALRELKPAVTRLYDEITTALREKLSVS
ncbi:response regulator [Nibricoccus sp. IMCC34717]|uniref:PAS domain-containing hybrid sensor histidine kinase/response regulator n=1 Tax=Nibricoccus sp. IMCC34717 TaxID=3034021 RepID=UPI00384F197A